MNGLKRCQYSKIKIFILIHPKIQHFENTNLYFLIENTNLYFLIENTNLYFLIENTIVFTPFSVKNIVIITFSFTYIIADERSFEP